MPKKTFFKSCLVANFVNINWFKQNFICNLTSILQYKNSMIHDLTVSYRLQVYYKSPLATNHTTVRKYGGVDKK